MNDVDMLCQRETIHSGYPDALSKEDREALMELSRNLDTNFVSRGKVIEPDIVFRDIPKSIGNSVLPTPERMEELKQLSHSLQETTLLNKENDEDE